MNFESHNIYIVRNVDKDRFIQYLDEYETTTEIPVSFLKGSNDATDLNAITVNIIILCRWYLRC